MDSNNYFNLKSLAPGGCRLYDMNHCAVIMNVKNTDLSDPSFMSIAGSIISWMLIFLF